MEKLKLFVCILFIAISGFNLGMYTAVAKEGTITGVSPDGFIEPFRWVVTPLCLILFIVLAFYQAKRID